MSRTATIVVCALAYTAGAATFMAAAYHWLERQLPHQR